MHLDPGDDPAVWLATAREHLVVVENDTLPVRIRCFSGQRAVEIAIKGVLVHHGVRFPYVHTIDELIALVPGGVPENVAESDVLTPYAVQEMYPTTFTDLGTDHAAEAVELARTVVAWAVSVIESRG